MNKPKDERDSKLRDGESFPVYKPPELARMLGVSTDTLRVWRIAGRGPPFIRETSKSCVYLRESVDRWLKSHERHQQAVYHRPKPKAKRKRQTRADNGPTPAESESPGA